MNRFFVALPTCALLVASALPSQAADPVKIGVVTALSGPLATIGQRSLRGVQMAVDQINAKGGLLGRPVQIVQADDGASPATANTIARGMIQNDGVKALFGSSSSASAAAEANLAGQFKLPMIIFAGNDIGLTTTNFNPFIFQLQPSTYMEPRAVSQYLAKTHAGKPLRIFAISPDYSFGHSYVSNFMAGLKASGVKATLVGEQYPPLASTDYTSYISAALAAKPDFVFVGIFAGDLVTFIRQAKGYGLFQKLKVGISTATDIAESLKAETPAGAVMWARAPFFAIGGKPIDDFAQDHFRRFHEWPSDWPVLAYSSVQIWADGVRKAGSFDGPKLAAAISGGTFDTIRGKLTLRACDHQANASVYVGIAAAKVDPRYGFPILEQAQAIDASKTMMTCDAAVAQQRK